MDQKYGNIKRSSQRGSGSNRFPQQSSRRHDASDTDYKTNLSFGTLGTALKTKYRPKAQMMMSHASDFTRVRRSDFDSNANKVSEGLANSS